MRKLLLLALLMAFAASTASAAGYSGVLYYTTFTTHEVRSLVVSGGVAGANTNLVTLRGADGIIWDPFDNNKLLIGGQTTDNVYRVPTAGGSFTTVNNSAITGGAFHEAILPPPILPPEGIHTAGLSLVAETKVLATGGDQPVPANTIGEVGLVSGNVINHTISGLAQNRAGGVEVANGLVYVNDGPENGIGGVMYTVNLGSNVATPLGVLGLENSHGLNLDPSTGHAYSGHMYSGGAKKVQEIDLGLNSVVRTWDLSGLIPETTLGWIDQISADDCGNLFAAANSGEIIWIDLNSPNSFSLVTNVGVGLDDMVAGPCIPEPSTLLLAGVGLLGLGLLKKRLV